MPETSGALRSGQGLVAALLAAVRLASITSGADEEEVVAEPAAGEPEAVVHESPGERAENLSSLVGVCETGRTSVCRRSPESPGRNPGLSSFRRAAWARSLPPPPAPVNFPAARARLRASRCEGHKSADPRGHQHTEVIELGTPHIGAIRHVLDRMRKARGEPPPLAVELPDDPRIRNIVVRPHSLASYDQLRSPSFDEEK